MNMFKNVMNPGIKRNLFDLTHSKKLSFNQAELIPTFWAETLPGDSWSIDQEMMLRFAPLVAPVMHMYFMATYFFYVPNRLLWTNFEKFLTGGRDGTAAPVWPNLQYSSADKAAFYKGTVSDYLGLPVTDSGMTVTNYEKVSALPFRAYQLIYETFFQDQNVNSELEISLADDTVSSAEHTKLTTLRKACWTKGYFESALPWAQRGTAASVVGTPDYSTYSYVYDDAGNLEPGVNIGKSAAGGAQLQTDLSNPITIHNLDGVDIDINNMRNALSVQHFLEKMARGGSRFSEYLLNIFGERSPDSRLQRPEFIAGKRSPVVISEVLNNTGPTADPASNSWVAGQGNMAGHGISVGKTGFKMRSPEHGILMGITTVLPKPAYQQGINRGMQRSDAADYFTPDFAHLGEQAIQQKEVYFDPEAANGANSIDFGYTPKYSEYKHIPDSVHGDFRDDLAHWHAGRIFTSAPSLNNSFLEANPTDRVFAVTETEDDKLYCQALNKAKAKRKIPYFSTPGLNKI